MTEAELFQRTRDLVRQVQLPATVAGPKTSYDLTIWAAARRWKNHEA